MRLALVGEQGLCARRAQLQRSQLPQVARQLVRIHALTREQPNSSVGLQLQVLLRCSQLGAASAAVDAGASLRACSPEAGARAPPPAPHSAEREGTAAGQAAGKSQSEAGARAARVTCPRQLVRRVLQKRAQIHEEHGPGLALRTISFREIPYIFPFPIRLTPGGGGAGGEEDREDGAGAAEPVSALRRLRYSK